MSLTYLGSLGFIFSVNNFIKVFKDNILEQPILIQFYWGMCQNPLCILEPICADHSQKAFYLLDLVRCSNVN